jgi:hypothetical protein
MTTTNINTETGIRYGSINQNHISSDAFDDIITQGDNVSFNNWLDGIKSSLAQSIESALDEFGIDCGGDAEDMANEIVDSIDNIGDGYQSVDCDQYEYKEDGYHIITDSYGDLIVIESPYWTYGNLASPCFPNGCTLPTNQPVSLGAVKCYCLGADWFDEFNPIGYQPYNV